MEQINWTVLLQTLITFGCAFIGSAGLWTLIDHRQQRKADKDMQEDEILKELKEIKKDIESLSRRINENEAVAARIRILKFADEIFMEMNHSKDAFDQCLADITNYRAFTKAHQEFANDITDETCEYILEVYHERLKNKDFARYGAYRNGGTE